MKTQFPFKGTFYFGTENENDFQKLDLLDVKLPSVFQDKFDYGLVPNPGTKLIGTFKINSPKPKVKFPKKLRRARKSRRPKNSGKNF